MRTGGTEAARVKSPSAGYHTDGIPQLLDRIHKARAKAKDTRRAIRTKWGLGDEDAVTIDRGVGFTGAGGKVKAAQGGDASTGPARDVLVGKMLRAFVSEDRAFTVAFGGTSVSAGHDNWFNQSYAHCYERAFRPSFRAAGGRLTVRNHAIRSQSCVAMALLRLSSPDNHVMN